MYTTSKEMILAAQRGGYAVPAFNFENMKMVQAILAAAEETASPVLLQTTLHHQIHDASAGLCHGKGGGGRRARARLPASRSLREL